MQQCGNCGRVYDESEYTRCPYCSKSDRFDRDNVVVYDRKKKKAIIVPRDKAHLYD